MLKNYMESDVRIGGRDLKNLTYSYMGVGGRVKNCQNHPYVINEWPLTIELSSRACFISMPKLIFKERKFFPGPGLEYKFYM